MQGGRPCGLWWLGTETDEQLKCLNFSLFERGDGGILSLGIGGVDVGSIFDQRLDQIHPPLLHGSEQDG